MTASENAIGLSANATIAAISAVRPNESATHAAQERPSERNETAGVDPANVRSADDQSKLNCGGDCALPPQQIASALNDSKSEHIVNGIHETRVHACTWGARESGAGCTVVLRNRQIEQRQSHESRHKTIKHKRMKAMSTEGSMVEQLLVCRAISSVSFAGDR